MEKKKSVANFSNFSHLCVGMPSALCLLLTETLRERTSAFLSDIRYPLYRLLGSKYYIPPDERNARYQTEVHNQRPGDGITAELYYQILEPLGFEVKLYPHNHDLGAEVLAGKYGKLPWKFRLSQRLSGINPDTLAATQSIMCIARRNG